MYTYNVINGFFCLNMNRSCYYWFHIFIPTLDRYIIFFYTSQYKGDKVTSCVWILLSPASF